MAEYFSLFIAVLIGLPALSLFIICAAAFLPRLGRAKQEVDETLPFPGFAILVPAHNESDNILPTIQNLKTQIRPEDRLIVIADNCDDDTAKVAQAAGAEVIERHSAVLRGKGYALAFGVNHLRALPPSVVVVVDADCLVSAGGVMAIARRCYFAGLPVQMANLMDADSSASLRTRIHQFAQLIKNQVRSEGTDRLASTCQLMGTGMALPWKLANTANLGTGHVAEDMKLGAELAGQGYSPLFLASAKVSSVFPMDSQSVKTQKTRWEHGHLATWIEEFPRMLWRSIVQRNLSLFVLAMDLSVPPIALYLMVLSMSLLAFTAGALIWPVLFMAACAAWSGFALACIAILWSWHRVGRNVLGAGELMSTPLYAIKKIPSYLAFFARKRSSWVRAKRSGE